MKDKTSLSFKLKIITSEDEDNYPIGTILHTVVKKIADSFKKMAFAIKLCLKVARLGFLGGIPPTFEHYLRRHE